MVTESNVQTIAVGQNEIQVLSVAVCLLGQEVPINQTQSAIGVSLLV